MTKKEELLLTCLQVIGKAGENPTVRQKKVTDHSAWKLLEDKSWWGLVLVAVNKEEKASEDGSSRVRGSRSRRRGVRTKKGAESWIENVDSLIGSDAPLGYRMASMLVQKARMGSKWIPSWDSELEKLHVACGEGIHPAWHQLGKEAPILSQLEVYPKASSEFSPAGNLGTWIESAKIDPSDRSSLANWLNQSFPFQLTADVELAVQHFKRSLESKGKIGEPSNSFDTLSGDAVLIRALCRLAVGDQKGFDDLTELTKSGGDVAEVANNLLALSGLRNGDFSYWNTCYNAEGVDSLAQAMQRQAWMDIPQDIDLSSGELLQGLELVDGAGSVNALSWALLSAQIREGEFEDALQLSSKLDISESNRTELVIKLVEESKVSEELTDLIHRLELEIGRFDDLGIQLILGADGLPIHLRALAANQVQLRESLNDEGLNVASLDVFTHAGDAVSVGSILMNSDDGAITYPHRTILVYHLLPGDAPQDLCEWVSEARPRAIEKLSNEASGVLSETSIGLIKLLEGAPADLGGIKRRVEANREAIRAFNQCCQALLKGGDGLVKADRLDKLESSIEKSSLNGVELRLFKAVLDKLRLNRAIRLLEDNSNENTNMAIEILEKLVGMNPRKRIVDDVRQMVLEHDSIAIPAFAKWHRIHATSSSWHQIILASIEEKRGSYLNAARSLHKASLDDKLFEFGPRVRLARRALIAYAHAGKFSDAVNMLESQQALTSAMTGLFQLYLRVCDDALNDRPEAARRKLKEQVEDVEVSVVENEDGEMIERRRKSYPTDELDLLFTYPTSRNLPLEPWQGRVRATIEHVKKENNRRNPRSQLESQFRDLMRDKPTVQDVQRIAEEASGLKPIQGLMMVERAINSGTFTGRDMKALVSIQNGMYREFEDDLGIRDRTKLRSLKLKSLILVDTNLLIDAAKERIGWLLSDEGGIEIHAHGLFHRTILYKADAKMVELMIPNAAENEFKKMMGNPKRVRSLFGDIWIDEGQWNKSVTPETIAAVCSEVLKEYSTWNPRPGDAASEELFEERTVEFMVRKRDTYSTIADDKMAHNPKSLEKRTTINGDAIYPERGDRDIMRDAAMLAEANLKGVGTILVASRDSDFWIVRRSLEETFGFGVVRTARELSQWS